MNRYFSRKFLLTLVILALATVMPILYKEIGVSDMVSLSVLAILSGVGVGYGFINLKSKSLGQTEDAAE